MEVNLKATQDVVASTSHYSPSGAVDSTTAESVRAAAVTKGKVQNNPATAVDQPLTRQQMENVTADLTQFMQSMNADISFSIHEKTGRLMVQVKDSKGTVVKEFPSHELLDTIAAISERIGALLDRKV
jgi:flagellar protein FlaG